MIPEYTYWYADEKSRTYVEIPASKLIIRGKDGTRYLLYVEADNTVSVRVDGQLIVTPKSSNKIEIKDID